jgi:hypothetical protein
MRKRTGPMAAPIGDCASAPIRTAE